ncbi:hypothetical protein GE118_04135 [Mycoplasma sp. NEAQ87857]|uniref:GA module-containing protein n=1 Tax=Mycoplasma sp. NEAQ87857 TaxID=2683967 RepID=UPI0013184255|nr:GA module-containing protein [Mycoplasma sp. NEAQ87857]QGZ97965.1 hypothetical protein GE118_04135 [Mycoplasma sp. NEAQ87857]
MNKNLKKSLGLIATTMPAVAISLNLISASDVATETSTLTIQNLIEYLDGKRYLYLQGGLNDKQIDHYRTQLQTLESTNQNTQEKLLEIKTNIDKTYKAMVRGYLAVLANSIGDPGNEGATAQNPGEYNRYLEGYSNKITLPGYTYAWQSAYVGDFRRTTFAKTKVAVDYLLHDADYNFDLDSDNEFTDEQYKTKIHDLRDYFNREVPLLRNHNNAAMTLGSVGFLEAVRSKYFSNINDDGTDKTELHDDLYNTHIGAGGFYILSNFTLRDNGANIFVWYGTTRDQISQRVNNYDQAFKTLVKTRNKIKDFLTTDSIQLLNADYVDNSSYPAGQDLKLWFDRMQDACENMNNLATYPVNGWENKGFMKSANGNANFTFEKQSGYHYLDRYATIILGAANGPDRMLDRYNRIVNNIDRVIEREKNAATSKIRSFQYLTENETAGAELAISKINDGTISFIPDMRNEAKKFAEINASSAKEYALKAIENLPFDDMERFKNNVLSRTLDTNNPDEDVKYFEKQILDTWLYSVNSNPYLTDEQKASGSYIKTALAMYYNSNSSAEKTQKMKEVFKVIADETLQSITQNIDGLKLYNANEIQELKNQLNEGLEGLTAAEKYKKIVENLNLITTKISNDFNNYMSTNVIDNRNVTLATNNLITINSDLLLYNENIKSYLKTKLQLSNYLTDEQKQELKDKVDNITSTKNILPELNKIAESVIETIKSNYVNQWPADLQEEARNALTQKLATLPNNIDSLNSATNELTTELRNKYLTNLATVQNQLDSADYSAFEAELNGDLTVTKLNETKAKIIAKLNEDLGAKISGLNTLTSNQQNEIKQKLSDALNNSNNFGNDIASIFDKTTNLINTNSDQYNVDHLPSNVLSFNDLTNNDADQFNKMKENLKELLASNPLSTLIDPVDNWDNITNIDQLNSLKTTKLDAAKNQLLTKVQGLQWYNNNEFNDEITNLNNINDVNGLYNKILNDLTTSANSVIETLKIDNPTIEPINNISTINDFDTKVEEIIQTVKNNTNNLIDASQNTDKSATKTLLTTKTNTSNPLQGLLNNVNSITEKTKEDTKNAINSLTNLNDIQRQLFLDKLENANLSKLNEIYNDAALLEQKKQTAKDKIAALDGLGDVLIQKFQNNVNDLLPDQFENNFNNADALLTKYNEAKNQLDITNPSFVSKSGQDYELLSQELKDKLDSAYTALSNINNNKTEDNISTIDQAIDNLKQVITEAEQYKTNLISSKQDAIDDLDFLSGDQKTSFKNQIAGATSEAKMDTIIENAKSLDDSYENLSTKLNAVPSDYTTNKTKAFNLASKETQDQLEAATEEATNLNTNKNDNDTASVNSKANVLTDLILKAQNEVQNYLDESNKTIDNLNNFNDGLKNHFKDLISHANTKEEIQDIINQANQLNDAYTVLENKLVEQPTNYDLADNKDALDALLVNANNVNTNKTLNTSDAVMDLVNQLDTAYTNALDSIKAKKDVAKAIVDGLTNNLSADELANSKEQIDQATTQDQLDLITSKAQSLSDIDKLNMIDNAKKQELKDQIKNSNNIHDLKTPFENTKKELLTEIANSDLLNPNQNPKSDFVNANNGDLLNAAFGKALNNAKSNVNELLNTNILTNQEKQDFATKITDANTFNSLKELKDQITNLIKEKAKQTINDLDLINQDQKSNVLDNFDSLSIDQINDNYNNLVDLNSYKNPINNDIKALDLKPNDQIKIDQLLLDATTKPQADIVKAKALAIVELDKLSGLTDEQIQEFKDQIVNDQTLDQLGINNIVNKAKLLNQKNKSLNEVNNLGDITPENKEKFINAINNANDIENVIDLSNLASLQDKKDLATVIINETALNEQEKQALLDELNSPTTDTEEKVEDIIAKANALNLDKQKQDALKQLDKLHHLSPIESNDFRDKINASNDVLEISQLIKDATLLNEKNKANQEINDDLLDLDELKDQVINNVNNAHTVKEVQDLMKVARLDNAKHNGIKQIKQLQYLSNQEKQDFIDQVNSSTSSNQIQEIVNQAILKDKQNQINQNIDNLTHISQEQKDLFKNSVNTTYSIDQIEEIHQDARKLSSAYIQLQASYENFPEELKPLALDTLNHADTLLSNEDKVSVNKLEEINEVIKQLKDNLPDAKLLNELDTLLNSMQLSDQAKSTLKQNVDILSPSVKIKQVLDDVKAYNKQYQANNIDSLLNQYKDLLNKNSNNEIAKYLTKDIDQNILDNNLVNTTNTNDLPTINQLLTSKIASANNLSNAKTSFDKYMKQLNALENLPASYKKLVLDSIQSQYHQLFAKDQVSAADVEQFEQFASKLLKNQTAYDSNINSLHSKYQELNSLLSTDKYQNTSKKEQTKLDKIIQEFNDFMTNNIAKIIQLIIQIKTLKQFKI